MKTNAIFFFLSLVFFGLIYTSCNRSPKQVDTSEQSTTPKDTTKVEVVLRDYGTEPSVLDIDAYTMSNTNFRTALWTGEKLQVTLMSIPVGGEVGLELHPQTEQFLRIEDGTGKVLIGDSKDSLHFTQEVSADFAVFVPAGKWHNIINTGDKPLKLYSIYSPAEHPKGTVHQTPEESMEAEHHH